MTQTIQAKKMLIVNILDILRRYSDENHRLSQKDIVEILDNEYRMKVDRKSVKRNLMNLAASGYDISYSESIRRNSCGEEEIIYSDWYLERDFTDAELRLLIDSLLFSKHIPYSQCKMLIGKLEGLSNVYFKAKVKHVCNLPENMPNNNELFYIVEILDEAIEKGYQVVFNYIEYGVDKKPHLRLDSEGKVREYLINPYQMVATNGSYYLICNYDKYDNVSNYRVNQIRNIRLTDNPVKPMKKVKGLEKGLNLPKHMAEHIYMFSGESIRVVFKTPTYMAGEIINRFGTDPVFKETGDGNMEVTLSVNGKAMKYWALQYAPYVKVLSPDSFVSEIKEDLKRAVAMYEE